MMLLRRRSWILFVCFLAAFALLGFGKGLWTVPAEAATPSLSRAEGFDQTLYDTLYAGLIECRDTIDLRGGEYTVRQLDDTFSTLIVQEPDLFYVSGSYRYSRYDNGTVTSMVPEYLYDKAQIPSLVEDWERRVDQILSLVEPQWTDGEKALFFHDYICDTFAYDDDLIIGDAYTFLLEGEGVCQAYTLLYDKLLTECGIPVYSVVSSSLNHVWSQVKLGSSFYHVDVTWDDEDPVVGGGLVSHKYYLLSTDAMYALRPASDMIAPENCDSKTYDNSSLRDVTSATVYCGGSWYGIKEGGLVRVNVATGSTTHVLTLPTEWTASPTTYYEGTFSSLYRYGNLLLYNTPTELCYYNPASNTGGTLMRAGGNGKAYLYGFSLSDYTVTYTNTDRPNKRGPIDLTADARALDLTVVYKVADYPYAEQSYQRGDLLELPSVPFTFRHEGLAEPALVEGWQSYYGGEVLTGNLTVEARIGNSDSAILYNVTWVIDGVPHTDRYVKGEIPVCSASTDKAPDADALYFFDGWSPAPAPVTGDVTYTATYRTSRNYYLVTFVSPGGSQTVRYALHEVPTMPQAPEKEADERYTYVFSEWRLTDTADNGDLTYTAIYETIREYAYSAAYFVNCVESFVMQSSLRVTYSSIRALRTIAASVNPAGEGVAQAMEQLELILSQYNQRVAAANSDHRQTVVQILEHFGMDTDLLVALPPSKDTKRRLCLSSRG